jgi:hypothetical protein
MTQAQLPSGIQSETIGDMQPGDEGWTVPWAMYADSQSRLWLNGSYTLSVLSRGTVQMHVWRSDQDGLWRVDTRRCKHEWSHGDPCYTGRYQPVPVAEITCCPNARASDLIAQAERERDEALALLRRAREEGKL